jgi:DNA-binding CsgD family transcriptional regulator
MKDGANDRGRMGEVKTKEPLTGADLDYGARELARFDMIRADPVMADLQQDVVAACTDLGFERFVAWILWPANGGTGRRSTYVTNYSPDWMRRRLRNHYSSHDVVATRAMQTGRPFFWADLERRHLTEAQARVMEEARTFGLRTGAALTRTDSVSGRLCLCVSTITSQKDFAKLFAARQPQLETLMTSISKQFRVFQEQDAARAAAPVLTPHECEVLMYAARGLTTQRTAVKMGISDYTVKDHIKAAIAKLDAKNKTEAVAKALISGFILP